LPCPACGGLGTQLVSEVQPRQWADLNGAALDLVDLGDDPSDRCDRCGGETFTHEGEVLCQDCVTWANTICREDDETMADVIDLGRCA
jgi:hypothetical protein